MGTPTAELEKGQWNLGYNYTFSQIDLDDTDMEGTWTTSENGDETGDGDLDDWELEFKDFKLSRHYLSIGYGLSDQWEVYAQLGSSSGKGKAKNKEATVWDSGNFDTAFAWGLGTRITIVERGKVKWGFSAQTNGLNTSMEESETYEEDGSTVTETDEIEVTTVDLLLAAGPTVDLGRCKLYGGLFLYSLFGVADYEYTETETNGTTDTWTEESDGILSTSSVGAFIGAQVALSKNFDLTTAFSATNNGWAWGFGVGFKF